MAHVTVLPTSYTSSSVVTVDDYGSGPNVDMTISEVISHLKDINSEFNAFVLITNYGRYIGPILAWKLLPGTPYIGCNPYLTSGYYSVGIKRDLLDDISGSNVYCLINGVFQLAPGYGMTPTIETKDGVSYATYNRPSDWATPIVAVEADELYINNVFTAFYSWTAWNQISGNSGQYRCDLTMIKDSALGNVGSIVFGDGTNFDRLSAQSSIWNTYHNTPFNQETTIAWSGNGKMTLTLIEDTSTTPTSIKFMFKFYRREISETVPFYQEYFAITPSSGGATRATNMYLSFVYDPAQTVALFAPVVEDAVSGQYYWGGVATHNRSEMEYLFMWLAASGSPESDNPYSTGTTDDGGNPGGPTPQSHIDVPTAPTLGGLNHGMVTLYCPTGTQLTKISQFLWSSGFIDNVAKFFNNVSDNIIALFALPYKPLNNPTKVLTVGNYQSDDTDLQAVEYINDRFYTIDMGSVRLKPFWGSYLDYSPYSKLSVYLPGIGLQQLDPDDIFCPSLADGTLSTPSETTLHLDYMIDMMTGSLVAFISINGEMRYQFAGKIGYSIPITGANYTRMIQGAVTAISGLIGTAVTGGAAAPFAASAAVAGIVNAQKPDVIRGSNLSGDVSMMTRKTPFLIYSRPNKPLLENQGKFTGFPSYKIGLLSEFTGYTEVLDAHVEGISCTDEERDKILAALKGGVII